MQILYFLALFFFGGGMSFFQLEVLLGNFEYSNIYFLLAVQ